MSINIQDKQIQTVYKGSIPISRIYKGENQVFAAIDPLNVFIKNCETLAGDSDLIRSCYNAIDSDIQSNAAVLLFPSVVDNKKVYGMNTITGDLVPFSFERQSTATFFDKSLNLKLTQIDIPRIDYANYSTEAKILVEKESTNTTIYSNLSYNAADSISGKNYEIVSDSWDNRFFDISKSSKLIGGTASNHYSFFYKSKNPRKANTDYTMSAFVKNEEKSEVVIRPSYPKDGDCLFMVGTNSNVKSSVSVVDLKDGIYRASIVGSYDYNINNLSWGFSKNYLTQNVPFYYSGMQHEEGNIATSYIPTSNVAATRSADKLSVNLPADTKVYIKTTTEQKFMNKPAGLWNIHEDITQSDGIICLAIMK